MTSSTDPPSVPLPSLVVLTPTKQSAEHTIIQIHREIHIDSDKLLHVAAGHLMGIVVYKYGEFNEERDPHVQLCFSVAITDGKDTKQEKRTLDFYLRSTIEMTEGRAVVHTFFKQLVANLPNDYTSFIKKMLVLLQQGFPEIERIATDFKIVAEEEQVVIPEAAQYDSSSEVEEVTVAHVQEILEHAYPNGLTIDIITESLRCSIEEATQFLLELEASGIVKRESDEWIRVDTHTVNKIGRQQHGTADQPTIAIITCLFVEKQAVDALLEDSYVIHKYKCGGDSNIYTLGKIGAHKVVATKLAIIGDSREAITSAGSITTRLLGNFQHIEHVFVVGVGGAVPHFTDASLHARLGDVIISAPRPDAYVYSHDLIVDRKTEQLTGFAVRKWNPASSIVEQTLQENAYSIITEWNTFTDVAIKKLNEETNDVDFYAPDPTTDILAIPAAGGQMMVIPHPNQERKCFEMHLGSIGAIANIKKLSPENGEDEENIGQIKERFCSEYHLRALDVGFDSVVAAIVGSRIDSWALVRGIADYQHGQSRASRKWQAHAAARAAAMTRVLIERLPSN